MTPAAAVERTVRESYGRLLAMAAARTRDIASAEDALAEALRAALETWPKRGVPERPEAWLLTVARRSAGAARRRTATRDRAAATLHILAEERAAVRDDAFPDRRLTLMLACAGPEVAENDRTPLMLQVVLGLDAARVAAVYLCSPVAMARRLTRAKERLRAEGGSFPEPEPEMLAARLPPVLEALYAAFGACWSATPGAAAGPDSLAADALSLARLAAAGAPDDAEATGLVALMLHVLARAGAGRDARGRYTPLTEQDPALWRAPLIDEAEALLRRAAARGAPGRWQIEAAIQSAHAARRVTGRTDWTAILALYRWLDLTAPSIGATIAHAAALGAAGRPADGLALLDGAAATAGDHQPWWATRANLLGATRSPEADAAYARAIGLCADPAVRAFLAEQRAALHAG